MTFLLIAWASIAAIAFAAIRYMLWYEGEKANVEDYLGVLLWPLIPILAIDEDIRYRRLRRTGGAPDWERGLFADRYRATYGYGYAGSRSS